MIVNTDNQVTPWLYTETDGKIAANTMKPGDFFEGGIDV